MLYMGDAVMLWAVGVVVWSVVHATHHGMETIPAVSDLCNKNKT